MRKKEDIAVSGLPVKVNPRGNVVQTNPILECGYSLGDRAQRLMKVIISRIDDKRDEDFHVYEFQTSELYETLGLSSTQDSYGDLKKAIDELMNVKIEIPSHLSYDGADVLTRMLQKGRIHKRQGWTTIQIDGELKPFFLQVKGKFTKYELQEVLSFRGEYTIRFYEWFKADQFKAGSKSGAWYISLSLQDLRFRLGMLDKNNKPVMYDRWPDFRRRVIEPVVEEISEKSQYTINYETVVRWGRRVDEIKFHIIPKKVVPKTKTVTEAPAKRRGKTGLTEEEQHRKKIEILKKLALKKESLWDEIKEHQAMRMKKLLTENKFLKPETVEELALEEALIELEDKINEGVL